MCKNLALLEEIDKHNITLIEDNIPFKGLKGLYFDDNIIIDSKLKSEYETNCVLAEELGHYHTSTGNILMQDTLENIKQERQARDWAIDRLISLEDIVKAFSQGIDNRYELADFLEVTEELVDSSIEYFRRKYGISTMYESYEIYFIPNLYVKKRRINK